MRELVSRLTPLDPGAAEALRVIDYFDHLSQTRAGAHAIVRAVAALAGAPVRYHNHGLGVVTRVVPDGSEFDVADAADAAWPLLQDSDVGVTLCIERPPPATQLDDIILERALIALGRELAGRRRSPRDDVAAFLTQSVLDPDLDVAERLHSLSRLLDGRIDDAVVGFSPVLGARIGQQPEEVVGVFADQRVGISRRHHAADLPDALGEARTAYRFTAEGTSDDPGPRVVSADSVGALMDFAAVTPSRPARLPADVADLDRCAREHLFFLPTLDAFIRHGNLRDAAASLYMHHSTFQDRLVKVESALGWTVRSPHNRLRAHLALNLRRLYANPEPIAPATARQVAGETHQTADS